MMRSIGASGPLEMKESVEVDYVACDCGCELPFSSKTGYNYIVCWSCRAVYHRFASERRFEFLGYLCEGSGSRWCADVQSGNDNLLSPKAKSYDEKLFKVGTHWLCYKCVKSAVAEAKGRLQEATIRLKSTEKAAAEVAKYEKKLKERKADG